MINAVHNVAHFVKSVSLCAQFFVCVCAHAGIDVSWQKTCGLADVQFIFEIKDSFPQAVCIFFSSFPQSTQI